MKEKGDTCIFVGYSTQSRAYRVFNKRTRVIVETIHVNFDELPQMASDHVSSDPVPECQRMALEQGSLSPDPQCQDNVTQADKTVTTSNELDLQFSPMFDELLNGSSKVVSKSSSVTIGDAPNQHQHHPSEHRWTKDHPLEQVIRNPSQSVSSDPAPTCQIMASDQISSDPAPECQTVELEHDSLSPGRKCQENVSHGDKTVIGNPSQSIRTRRQLESDAEMCMFALTVSRTEPNIKEAMADFAWIESMQEELHQFDRLDV
nr:hypothetical protein [Tanacetum cinerariifolium]